MSPPILRPPSASTEPPSPSSLSDPDQRLLIAVREAHPEAVAQALKDGANVNVRDLDKQGQAPLTQSAIYLKPGFDVVDRIHDLLLAAGANVAQQDDLGHTALDNAALFDHWRLCNALLDAGARTDPVDDVGRDIPPMARALVDHRLQLVRRLLNAGGSIPRTWGGDTMLSAVLKKSDLERLDDPELCDLIRLMLTHTPGVSSATLDQGLLDTLRVADRPTLVQTLLDAGATMAPREAFYQTFIEVDEEPHMITATGWTALHEAVTQNRERSVPLLLAAGADPLQPALQDGHRPMTAIDLARIQGAVTCLSLLEQVVLRQNLPDAPGHPVEAEAHRVSRPRL